MTALDAAGRRANDRGEALDLPGLLGLIYVALPTVIFLAGWVVFPFGPIAAIFLSAAVLTFASPLALRVRSAEPRRSYRPLIAIGLIATAWPVLGGIGHWVYANPDWIVRDAVLVDLVRDSWPVYYHVDGTDLVLRAPIGYFLPASLVGKLWGIGAAVQSLLIWTILGVALTFALLVRDRPTSKVALIRIAIFIAFSGMDIVGTFAHYNPHRLGEHLEWWAYIFQYSSQTTQLFWVPNHALSGWVATAWLIGQKPDRLPTTPAVLFVLLTPIWSPLTAVGVAALAVAALVRRALVERPAFLARAALDWRLLLVLAPCLCLIYPYLVAGSGEVASGSNTDFLWVGEDIVPRTIEFIVFEFLGFAILLILRNPRDPLLWTAVISLLLLPLHRFGPYNDLTMRASIPGLTLLAIEVGRWISTPGVFARSPRSASIAVLLLSIGAVTPFMEFARSWMGPVWPVDVRSSLIDVTRGAHYLTSPDHAWLREVLRPEPR